MKKLLIVSMLLLVIISLIGISVVTLTRTIDTEPKRVYIDVEPSKPSAETEVTQAPAESTTETAEKPITESIGETKENAESDTTTPSLLDKTKVVQVSPLGLGPFPEIPKEFPYFSDWSHRLNPDPKPPDWPPSQHSPSWDEALRSWELMDRVKVELWRQGIKATGVRMRGIGIGQGLIYPTIPGVVYIERVGDRIEIMSSHEDDDLGMIDDFHEMETGHIPEEQMMQFNAIRESGFRIEDIPHGLKVIEGGINPYTFLNLK